MHSKIKELTNRKRDIRTDSGCIKDKDGNLLFERNSIAIRWTEYIKTLYSDETRPPPKDIINPEGPEILIEEVTKAIRNLKEKKAPGEDGITGEQLKALDEEALKVLTKLLNNIYSTGVIPKDLKQSVFVKIPKKPKAVECTEYRTICLMSHVTKILLRIIMDRNETIFEREISKGQTGFRSGRGTREGIFNIRAVLEKMIAIDQDVYICFIDYQKAFDRVYHTKIIEFLGYTEMDTKDLRVIQNLYWEQKAVVRLQEGNSEEFSIERGVRQGCVLSPKLFNMYTEPIFRAIEGLQGLSIGGENINNFRYADDTALVADSAARLQEIVNVVKERSEELGLYMNVSKTKSMRVNKAGEERKVQTVVDGQDLDQVRDFKYLGQLITDDGKCDKEIKRRIAIARSSLINMKDVITTRKLTLNTRKRLVRCYILSTLLYASETWVMGAEMEDRIRSLEMWIYRRMMRISYKDHISNESILVGLNEKPKLMKLIKERKCRYFGHIVRGEGYKYQRLLMEGQANGKRGRGRPKTTWFKNISKWMKIDYFTATRYAQDRDRWRSMVSEVQDGHGTND